MGQLNPSTHDRTVTVRVPITIRRRGGRKLVLAPDGRAVLTELVVGPPHRQHYDQGDRAGLPLARHAGERPVRHCSRDRQRREDQLDLRRSRTAADAASAGYRGSNPEWAAAGRIAVRRADEAVPLGLEGTTSEVLQLKPLFSQAKSGAFSVTNLHALPAVSPGTPLN